MISDTLLQDKDARWEFCKEMHKLKTELFMEMIESGAMPLRPGVSRLISESTPPVHHLVVLLMLQPDHLLGHNH